MPSDASRKWTGQAVAPQLINEFVPVDRVEHVLEVDSNHHIGHIHLKHTST